MLVTVTLLKVYLPRGPEGTEANARVTGPANFPRLVTVIVEIPELPRIIERLAGLAETLKSST